MTDRTRNRDLHYQRAGLRPGLARMVAGWILTSWGWSLAGANLVAQPDLGLRVAAGFRVSLVADSTLANNIQAMTLDPEGSLVVSGQGYLRKLYDTDGDGRADSPMVLAATRTGAMGLAYDGDALCYAGDGGVWRLPDRGLEPLASGRPEQLLAVRSGERGAHALRQGPDGWWYLMAGEEAGIGLPHVRAASSPVRNPEGGALLRLSPDFALSEVLADGFRNPYDFSWNAWGDLFTADGDVEGDYLLPWYVPARLLRVAGGGDHGWLTGGGRGWSLPEYYPDVAGMLEVLGRLAPAGMVCYQHEQFPPYFQNGLFLLDWRFGRVLFVALNPAGASYEARWEVFLEPIGRAGFTPTDVCVEPDGSLLICTGGRGTRGAVYRVMYVAEPGRPLWAKSWAARTLSDTHAVLVAPQPLAAWSRAIWERVAVQLGPVPFEATVADQGLTPLLRVRAVEVLTELHGGLGTAAATAGSRADSPLVRGRVAWSLGRAPCQGCAPLLLALAQDPVPAVRLAALEAMLERADSLSNELLQAAITANLAHPEMGVRQAVAELLALLPEAAWAARWREAEKAGLTSRLTLTLGALWRPPSVELQSRAIEMALGALKQAKDEASRLEAVRLLMIAWGGWRVREPSAELYAPYELAGGGQQDRAPVEKARAAAAEYFPSGARQLDTETARLLAMLEDDNPAVPGKVLGLITARTPPELDFHYLTVLACLRAPPAAGRAARVAEAVVAMEKKLQAEKVPRRGNYTVRLAELIGKLQARDGDLAASLLQQGGFAVPAHVLAALRLGGGQQAPAARLFLAAAGKNPELDWPEELVRLLSGLPAEATFPVWRRLWTNLELRETVLLELAGKPAEIDRPKFVWGLTRPREAVVRASVTALLKLPRDRSGKTLPVLAQLLIRLLEDPEARMLRAQVLALLSHQTGRVFQAQERGTSAVSLQRAYAHVIGWLAKADPAVAREVRAAGLEDWIKVDERLGRVRWEQGNAQRGQAIFRERRCQECHGPGTVFGPDLAGLAGRLAPSDLLEQVYFPSRRLVPGYEQVEIRTRDGQTYQGRLAAESAEGVILLVGAETTVRLWAGEMASRQPSLRSPMPEGLLEGIFEPGLADLHAYLASLR